MYQIKAIVDKAADTMPKIDKLLLNMDLTATHVSGCPLDFKKLLDFAEFDFWHDIGGINRHIDRGTGELEDCFVPRCAMGQ